MRRLTGKMPDFSVYIAAIAAPYLFCALAGMLLGRCDAALRRLILACLWAAMLGSEGVKLAVLWSGNVQPPYVPLHFSSTFHLSVGLAVCARGRAKHAGQVLLFAGGLIMTAMIAVCPVSVLGDPLQMFSSHVHAHGYFFHMQVALQFFAASLNDRDDAWQRYLALVKKGGSDTYAGLVRAAGFAVPFEPGAIEPVAKQVAAWCAEKNRELA